MNKWIAALALTGSLATLTALAQVPTPRGARPPMAASGGNPRAGAAPTSDLAIPPVNTPVRPQAPAPKDPNVYEASAVLPAPTIPDANATPAFALPEDPIAPYLLTKSAGPFMVLAKTFRGPDAERYALALVLELRNDYHLPAYVLRWKDFPGSRSNIRNVPPTAPAVQDRSQLTPPERTRSYDEAAVLVGNEATLAGSEKLWHEVKKIKPKCLEGMPAMFGWRKGLSSALRTTNPFVPTQVLFPAPRDTLVEQMNQGPRSIFHCPGRYTLQIAEFSGRSTFNVDEAKKASIDILKRSPLATAADDAERLADALAKAPEIQQTGFQPYVYHDRASSKIMIGSFQSPNDPAAGQLRDKLVRLAVPIMDTKDPKGRNLRKRGIDVMIVPALALTDLENPDRPIKR